MAGIFSYSLFFLGLVTEVGSQADIRYPPKILTPEKGLVKYVKTGASFKVQCTAKGTPKPTYTWLRDKVPFIQDAQVQFNTVNGTLTFKNFDKNVDGRYQCVATNEFINVDGTRHSATCLSVVVRYIEARGKPWPHKTNISLITPEYAYLTLSCGQQQPVISGNIKYSWYWHTYEQILQLIDTIHYVDCKGTLYYPYVPQLEEGTEQTFRYLCGIALGENQKVLLSYPTYVTVNKIETNPGIRPQIRYVSGNVKAMKNGETKLECVASGYDPTEPHLPVITWYKESTKITGKEDKYTLSSHNRALTIKNLDERDEADYFCEAENSEGKSVRKNSYLNVSAPPEFDRKKGAPSDRTVIEGRNVSFHCNTHSARNERPPNPPVWFINGRKTGQQTDPLKFEFKNESKQLVVKNVSKATDILCVQCKVSNSEGTIRGIACLNVLLAIEITKRPPKQQTITYGKTVDLTVTARGDPATTLNFLWEFKGKKYPRGDAPPHVTYDPKTLKATITTSNLTHAQYETIAGVYMYHITSRYEKQIINTEVILKDKEPVSETLESESANTTKESEKKTGAKSESFFSKTSVWIAIIFFLGLIIIMSYFLKFLFPKQPAQNATTSKEAKVAFEGAEEGEANQSVGETVTTQTSYTTDNTSVFDAKSQSTNV